MTHLLVAVASWRSPSDKWICRWSTVNRRLTVDGEDVLNRRSQKVLKNIGNTLCNGLQMVSIWEVKIQYIEI